jgi:hypothetical protein
MAETRLPSPEEYASLCNPGRSTEPGVGRPALWEGWHGKDRHSEGSAILPEAGSAGGRLAGVRL